MKKVISLLLVTLMIFSMVTVVSAVDVNFATSVSIDKNIPAQNITNATDYIIVPVRLSGTLPEGALYVCSITVDFDNSKLVFNQASKYNWKNGAADPTDAAMCAYDTQYNMKGSPIGMAAPADNVNEVGSVKLMFASTDSNMITDASLDKDVFTYIYFTKKDLDESEDNVELAKGNAYVNVSLVQTTSNMSGVAVEYGTDNDYASGFSISNGSVILSDTFAVTSTNAKVDDDNNSETAMVDGATVEIKAAEADNSVADPNELDGDETVTVKVSGVVPGYKAVVKKDDVALTGVDTADGSGEYTFDMADADVNIDVTYEKRTYSINYPGATDGVNNWGTKTTAEFGESVTLAPDMKAQWSFTSLKANGEELWDAENKTIKPFTMGAGDVTITAETTFSAEAVTLTHKGVAVVAGEEADIVAGTAYTTTLPAEGEQAKTVTFEVYQKAGYEIVSVEAADGELSLIDDGEYTDKYSLALGETVTAVEVKINAKKIVREITGNDPLINVDELTNAGHSIDFVSHQTSAKVGQTVKFTVEPKGGMSITGVTAEFSDGSKKACDLVQSILFSVGGTYSFEYPADGYVKLYVTEASADVSLKSIMVKTEAGDEYPVTLTAPYSYRLPAYYNGNVTVEAKANNGDATVVVDPAAGAVITAGPSGKTYTITVTADDEVGGKVTTATYNVNVVNPFAEGQANLFLVDDVDAVTKGTKYSVAVKASGIPAGAAWVGFEIQLPKDIIAQYNDAVKFEIGSGVTADNPTTDITYNYKEGLVTAKILNGDGSKDFGLNANNETELLTISFDVIEDAKATTFDVVGTTANYSLDTSVNAVPFASIGKIELIPIVEEGASQADVYKALALGLYNEEDYTEQDWFDVRAAIKTAVEAIDTAANAPGTGNAATDAATAEAAMKEAIQTLKDTVGNYTDENDNYVDPVIQTLEQYKDYVKTLVEAKAAEFNANNTYDTSKTEIQDIVDKYNTDTTGFIDANTSRDEELIKLLVTDAEAEMDAVKTMAEYIADGEKEIEAIDTSIYTDEAINGGTTDVTTDGLEGALATAKKTIKEATTAQAVTDAVTTYKNTVAAATLITDDRAASNKEIDEYIAAPANGIVAENYSPSNWNKILIEEIRGELKISDATSEDKMDGIVADTIKAIGDVLTLAEEESAALKAINDATEISDIDIDLIQATGVDNIDSSKEELYKAAIWEATQGGTVDIIDKNANGSALDEFQDIIDYANALVIDTDDQGNLLRGDFNCSGTVDGSDAAGAMKYLCGVDLGWVPTAQGIVNADLCTPGDGVLTVYDVVQIIKEINL